MIESSHPMLSIRRQCELVGLNRATFYYKGAKETPFNLALMRVIDEEYTRTPFYGYRKMTARLQQLGYGLNHKRVAGLAGKMGLQAIYPRPRTSILNQQRKYPYLLRDMTIARPNQVWSTDITYVPMSGGFMYLVAILDWFSHFVLTWKPYAWLCNRVNSTSSTLIRGDSLLPMILRVSWRPITSDQDQHGWTWTRLRSHLH